MEPRNLFVLAIMLLLIILKRRQQERNVRQRLCISSLTGRAKMQEFLDGPTTNMYTEFRMDKWVFLQLCNHFREMQYLTNSKHIDLEEKMMIFLNIVSHNHSNRTMRMMFQHSRETISKIFHEVLVAMLKFSKEMIVAPNFTEPVGEIRTHRQLREGAFKGAIGAIDGTLIHAVVPPHKQIPFQARGGGDCFQNVMGVCDFNMKFTYVVAGWEGAAHDSRVLSTSVRNPAHNFPMPPPDKYYLCDAAYTHTRGFMTPYRGIRYWLADFRRGGRGRTKEEKFNHGHSQLRNVIERTFGVLKARFAILQRMPSYSFSTQIHIVIACCSIHNFLRRVALDDELFRIYEDDNVNNTSTMTVTHEEAEEDEEDEDEEEINEGDGAIPATQDHYTRENQAYMINLRNQIANALATNGTL